MALSVNQTDQTGSVLVDPNGYVAMNRILCTFLDHVTEINLADVQKIINLSSLIVKRVVQPDNEEATEEISLQRGLLVHKIFTDEERLF